MAVMRLDKAIAASGLASRREVRGLVAAGRVAVGGVRAERFDAHVEAASVTVDGEPLDHPDGLLVLAHKPIGLVCSHGDRDGPRLYDVLPAPWLRRTPVPTTVGRLDKDSSGLVIVTDDMALVHRLTSPRHDIEKRYRVTLDRAPRGDVDRLAEVFAAGSLVLDGSPCRSATLTLLPEEDPHGRVLEVVLTEGRHRQVRRMLHALGYEVAALVRTHHGPYALGDLAPGQWIDAPATDPLIRGG
jgi:16S rRNA pseudouridine516 synthase